MVTGLVACPPDTWWSFKVCGRRSNGPPASHIARPLQCCSLSFALQRHQQHDQTCILMLTHWLKHNHRQGVSPPQLLATLNSAHGVCHHLHHRRVTTVRHRQHRRQQHPTGQPHAHVSTLQRHHLSQRRPSRLVCPAGPLNGLHRSNRAVFHPQSPATLNSAHGVCCRLHHRRVTAVQHCQHRCQQHPSGYPHAQTSTF